MRMELQKLIGLEIVGIIIGPCGMHVDFESKSKSLMKLWLQAPVELIENGICVYGKAYPHSGEEGFFVKRLVGRVINDAVLDSRGNSLRLRVSGDADVFVGVFPEVNNIDSCWSYYITENEACHRNSFFYDKVEEDVEG